MCFFLQFYWFEPFNGIFSVVDLGWLTIEMVCVDRSWYALTLASKFRLELILIPAFYNIYVFIYSQNEWMNKWITHPSVNVDGAIKLCLIWICQCNEQSKTVLHFINHRYSVCGANRIKSTYQVSLTIKQAFQKPKMQWFNCMEFQFSILNWKFMCKHNSIWLNYSIYWIQSHLFLCLCDWHRCYLIL